MAATFGFALLVRTNKLSIPLFERPEEQGGTFAQGPPAPDSPTRDACHYQYIAVFGDTQTGHDIYEQIVADIMATAANPIFQSGDLVDEGTDPDQWWLTTRLWHQYNQWVQNPVSRLSKKLFHTPPLMLQ